MKALEILRMIHLTKATTFNYTYATVTTPPMETKTIWNVCLHYNQDQVKSD